jgi:hypothetical protein
MKNAKFVQVKSSLVGKPGETMEHQTVRKKVTVQVETEAGLQRAKMGCAETGVARRRKNWSSNHQRDMGRAWAVIQFIATPY